MRHAECSKSKEVRWRLERVGEKLARREEVYRLVREKNDDGVPEGSEIAE